MRRHPIAQKACGRCDDLLAAADLLQVDRLQPVTEGVLADFRSKLAQHSNKLRRAPHRRISTIVLNRLRHPLPPLIEAAVPVTPRQKTTLRRHESSAPPPYSIREEASSPSADLHRTVCQQLDDFLTLAPHLHDTPVFPAAVILQFIYVSDSWQWDRRRN